MFSVREFQQVPGILREYAASFAIGDVHLLDRPQSQGCIPAKGEVGTEEEMIASEERPGAFEVRGIALYGGIAEE